jgi:hypothetical protein
MLAEPIPLAGSHEADYTSRNAEEPGNLAGAITGYEATIYELATDAHERPATVAAPQTAQIHVVSGLGGQNRFRDSREVRAQGSFGRVGQQRAGAGRGVVEVGHPVIVAPNGIRSKGGGRRIFLPARLEIPIHRPTPRHETKV